MNRNLIAILRIKRDLTEFYTEKIPLIHVVPQDDDIFLLHVLIEGPEHTPYWGGFFYFTLRFPTDYPNNPPKVVLQTTGLGTIRFNPNIDKTGKVCLSILNTDGRRWTHSLSLNNVLLAVQSLMNKEPYYINQYAGLEKKTVSGESKKYNDDIEYETLRVAVIWMLEDSPDTFGMPQALKDVMVQRFKTNFTKYVNLMAKMANRDSFWFFWLFGKSDPNRQSDLKKLKEKLMYLKAKFCIGESDGEKEEELVPSYEAVCSVYLKPLMFMDEHSDDEDEDMDTLINEAKMFVASSKSKQVLYESDSDDDYGVD